MELKRQAEILKTLRMFAEADREAATPKTGETDRDVLVSWWGEFVYRLRYAAEFSTYVPNAMKWSRMADELEAFGREEDRKEEE